MAVRRPFGEADYMVQVFSQSVDVLLLLFQTQLVVFGQRLGTQVDFSRPPAQTMTPCPDGNHSRGYLKLVDQHLSLPVHLHDQITDGLLDLIRDRLTIFVDLLQPVANDKNTRLSH